MALKLRELRRRIERALTTDRVVAVMGPRQAGKTTLVRHQLRTERPLRYYNLKDPEVRAHLARQGRQELAAFPDHVKILDEVQALPELLQRVQVIVDERPGVQGQFVVLGSNHLLLNRQIKESLAGRVGLFHLPPLSLRELSDAPSPGLFDALVEAKGPAEAEAILQEAYLPSDAQISAQAALETLSTFGGFPELLTRRDPDDRRRWLRDYRQTYLQADLRELVDLRDPDTFERFERVFAPRVGSPLNLSDLARDCGVSPDTARRFLHYHEQLFVAWPCRPWFKNLAKRVIKAPKWYFTDTGLLRSINEDFASTSGAAFENTVLSELRKRLYLSTLRDDVAFSRTSNGVEADAVFSASNGRLTYFCEVKSALEAHPTHIRHLRRFVDEGEDRFGLLVTRAPGPERMGERIWSVPAEWLLA